MKYRGLFLNAGDRGLNPWAAKTYDPEFGNIGPRTYARIYQLMWRLKANTIWPAMTEADAAFNTVPGNYELARDMPDDRKDAFYELVQYTVNIGANLNLRQLGLDKSIAYGLQHRASANAYARQAKAAHLALVAEAQRYNEQTANGKWRYFVTDTPRDLPDYEAPHIPDWTSSIPGTQRCGVQVEGGGYFDSTGWYTPTLPLFHREPGDRSGYIDVFTEETADADWRAEPSEPWIKVDRGSGKFSLADGDFEQRIRVTVDWASAPKEGEGTVTISCSAGEQPIPVHVRLAPPATSKEASFIESAGIVSMYASHADEISAGWRERVLRNAALAKISDVHLSPGPHTLTVYALDPGVTLDRFEIRFRGAHAAYGPVPETRIRH